MDEQKQRKSTSAGAASGIYCLGLIGALVYYFQHAASFQEGVVGFFKALVWPAILTYEVLEFLSR